MGLLSSTFFISFAIAQVPGGLALDRIGARLSIGLFMWLSVLGSLLFSVADSPSLAFVGQVFIGIGCAPVFTGTMLIVGRNYPASRFSYYIAIIIAVGSIGDLLGTAPLAILAEWLGWRSALQVVMVLSALAASCCLLGLKPDRPDGMNHSLKRMLQGMARVTTVKGLWPIIPMFLTSYAVLMAVRGLWSGPYLADVYSLSTDERGNIILAMSAALGAGTFMLGVLDRLIKRTKRLVIVSSILTLLPLIVLAMHPDKGPYFAMWVFVAVGFFGFNYPLLMAHCRSFLVPAYYGRGMAFLTALSFIGVAIVQGLSGWVMNLAYENQFTQVERYQLLFFLLAGVLMLTTTIYLFSKPRGNGSEPL
ncbi:MFS transporter [Modicisalibacter tunisiensis]|uniref:MFS transporter n=1 Tax=Modicisalibacter tunisiensis TaxID=390637 RepID=UPI001CC9EB24|nr:MFS transporter [Modicisalibacter tunisiensis]MBZ9539112.1 MFS transporter [Modicisalibacter tunisiensis]